MQQSSFPIQCDLIMLVNTKSKVARCLSEFVISTMAMVRRNGGLAGRVTVTAGRAVAVAAA